MSTILKNKQMIHIATEAIALIGLAYYFSSKNKKLLEHIEDLAQRLEEQEDMIKKHEEIIIQLIQTVNNRHMSNTPILKPMKQPMKQPMKPKNTLPEQSRYKENETVQEVDSDGSEDSDLDADIAEELQDLNEELQDLNDEDVLKK